MEADEVGVNKNGAHVTSTDESDTDDQGGDENIRETRRILRQIQSHLTQSSINRGAAHEVVGLVDVIYHPDNKLPTLNYVTPRRSTAWISGKDVEHGLVDLRGRERLPRVEYIEGLFPPLFAKTLNELGLSVVDERPLMVFKKGVNTLESVASSDGIIFDRVNDQHASALWWYVWRNAHYDVITNTADPTFIGSDLRQIAMGTQIDIIMYRYRFPVGAVRVTVDKENESAQIVALAVMKEWRTPELVRGLQTQAIKTSLEQNCSLIFAAGVNEEDRPLFRETGLVDCGSVVCYAEKEISAAHSRNGAANPKETEAHVKVEQPVFPTH